MKFIKYKVNFIDYLEDVNFNPFLIDYQIECFILIILFHKMKSSTTNIKPKPEDFIFCYNKEGVPTTLVMLRSV